MFRIVSLPVHRRGVVPFCKKFSAQHLAASTNEAGATAFVGTQIRALQTYKFGVSQGDLDTIKATLPLVGESGTDFTKHFYSRLFKSHPELLNLFNQTNQKFNNQPKKLIKTVAVAATAAVETGELAGEAIEGVCQKHAALDVPPEAYAIVGEHLLGTIEDLLTDDSSVLNAWGALYGDIAQVFISREQELKDEMANTPGGWVGKRQFTLENKEKLSSTISRFKFVPVDGGAIPSFKAGKFTTVWVDVDSEGPYGPFTAQPRHYTLALPRNPDESKGLSVSIKRDGLVSNILHDSPEGTKFDLSAPFGCFNLSGVEELWLSNFDAPVVFLSGGVGITPVLAMLENIYVNRPASWLHSAKNGDVHAYRDRLREISAVRSGELQRRVWYSSPLPEDGPPGGNETTPALFNLAKYHYHGRMDLPKAAKDFPPEILHLNESSAQYFMCGPTGWMEDQRNGLLSLGVDEKRIHSEGF